MSFKHLTGITEQNCEQNPLPSILWPWWATEKGRKCRFLLFALVFFRRSQVNANQHLPELAAVCVICERILLQFCAAPTILYTMAALGKRFSANWKQPMWQDILSAQNLCHKCTPSQTFLIHCHSWNQHYGRLTVKQVSVTDRTQNNCS